MKTSSQTNQKNARSLAERNAEDGEFRDAGDAHWAAGEGYLHRDDDEHELQRQGCHGEHEASELQEWRGDDVGEQHCQDRAGEHGDERVPAVALAQDGVGVAADHAECGLADGELVREAEQQHDADGADRHRSGADADAEVVAVGIAQRIQQHRDDEQYGCDSGFAGHGPAVASTRPRRKTPPCTSSQASRTPYTMKSFQPDDT